MKCLHDAKIRTGVMATIHKYNCREIPELYKYLSSLDYVDSFAFDRMIPIGNSKEGLGNSIVDNDEYKEMMLQLFIFEILESKRKILTYKDSLWKPLFFRMGLTNPIDNSAKEYFRTCSAGGSSFCVLSDGTVYACRRLDIKAGKYPNESLESIFFGSPLFNILRNPDNDTGCKDCRLQYYCNGCPAMKYAVSGSIFGKDPNCWSSNDS